MLARTLKDYDSNFIVPGKGEQRFTQELPHLIADRIAFFWLIERQPADTISFIDNYFF